MRGANVSNPIGTSAANAATLWAVPPDDKANSLFPVTVTSRLVFNATPTKLGVDSVLAVAA